MTEHFFKTLKIENFRGIKSLEINDLARVNLFVGENNCGKTTVLEAGFLLSGINNPNLMIWVQNNRGVKVVEGADLRDLFYNRSHVSGTTFSATQAKGGRTLNVAPLYGNLQTPQSSRGNLSLGMGLPLSDMLPPLGVPSLGRGLPPSDRGLLSLLENGGAKDAQQPREAGASVVGQSPIGIDYNFAVSDQVAGKGECYRATTRWTEIGNIEFTLEPDKRYKESIPESLYLGKEYNSDFVDHMLNEKQKGLILSCLKSIDPKIVDIRTGTRGLVSVDIGLDSFIPINLLGDGIIHILKILSSIGMAGILFFDEIENGLHVSALEHAWGVVIDQSAKSNAQIFMTTHSGDAIKSLRNVLDSQLLSDAVACYRLVKFPDDVVRAYRYSGEQLGMALDSDTDIRV